MGGENGLCQPEWAASTQGWACLELQCKRYQSPNFSAAHSPRLQAVGRPPHPTSTGTPHPQLLPSQWRRLSQQMSTASPAGTTH